MIISKTPLRLSLGGGGTDLPSYYRRFGGFFIGAAIDKYVYVIVSKRYDRDIKISYSKTELVSKVDEIEHPSIREALKLVGIENGIDIMSVADAPASAGLGSSGSFCVGLLNALYAYMRTRKSPVEMAEEACDIAMNRLKEPSGKQDEYVASMGGINVYEISKEGQVKITALNLSTDILSELEHNILMFYTGITRSAKEVLAKEERAILDDSDTVKIMKRIEDIGHDSRAALESGNLRRFGELVHAHWLYKKNITPAMSNPQIDLWIEKALSLGAIGAKNCGAGGGGYIMAYCEENRDRVREGMGKEGLVEHKFHFDFSGSKVIYDV